MKLTIKNISRATQGVHCVGGMQSIEAGQTRTLDVAEDYRARLDALPYLLVGDEIKKHKPKGDIESLKISVDDSGLRKLIEESRQQEVEIESLSADLAKYRAEVVRLTAEIESLTAPPPVKLTTKHKGGGSYVILDADGGAALMADGSEVIKLSKDEAAEFDAMTAEQQRDELAKRSKVEAA